MVLLSPQVSPQPTAPSPPAAGPLDRWHRHRRLARQDRLSARLAQLHTVGEVLVRADALVAAGWLQGAWFGYPSPEGPRVSHLPGGRTAAAAGSADRFCLVSALHAATGSTAGPRLTRADRPVADRAVDTVWRTLAGVRADGCPPPEVRALRRLDLTRWNDTRGRTAEEVRDLLARAARTVAADRERALA